MSTTLSRIWLSVGPLFTVLSITPSFLVRFLPVKYQIEALNMLYTLVRERSVRSGFWSSQTLVKLGQTWSKLFELWEMYPGPRFEGFLGIVDPSWVRNGLVKLQSTLGQLWSNLVNLGKTWSDFGKCALDPFLRLFVMAGLRRIRSAWFGLPRFVCQHPRKSRG